ncbi:hypothetical protein [Nitrococcus mobilis]|uniref:Transposase n=1 Tax=Nitrococcus mobilis Nb-231 TaxID=314278 RepID=A4BMR6_9GAMM|nr:hypothetical protein [Nitrococcus mobilis]EAR23604.1 hypothetical protein NB231_17328 [Nitrococcus mobilis Nb-231]
MAMNPIQLQRGLALLEFQQRYGSEAACERALRAALWSHGFGIVDRRRRVGSGI